VNDGCSAGLLAKGVPRGHGRRARPGLRFETALTVRSGASNPSAPNLSRLLIFALDGTAQLPP
jgi:hypothetical protein